MSIHKPLERLEGRAAQEAPGAVSKSRERLWERYFHTYENARREIAGLEPLPELPYTEEDRADDMDTLAETIPAYRASPGYQSGEGKAFLDHWEQSLREKLKRGVEGDG